MIKNHYFEELGVENPTPTIRWPLALVILAVLAAAVIWLAVVELKAYHPPPPMVNAAARVLRPPPPGRVPLTAPHPRAPSPAHGLT